jgi:hypothetical protein
MAKRTEPNALMHESRHESSNKSINTLEMKAMKI